MAEAVAADTWGHVRASTGLSWRGHGVLSCAVGQPPRIAPVEPILFEGNIELGKRGQCGTLLLTSLLGLIEVQLVAPPRGVIREHHT